MRPLLLQVTASPLPSDDTSTQSLNLSLYHLESYYSLPQLHSSQYQCLFASEGHQFRGPGVVPWPLAVTEDERSCFATLFRVV